MSDLTDKQWEEYLGLDKRNMLWRAHAAVCSAQCSLNILDHNDLRLEAATLAKHIEDKLKELYDIKPNEEANNGTVHP
jgi:hypothetical protein